MGLDNGRPPDRDGNVIAGVIVSAFLVLGFIMLMAIAGWAWRLL